MSRFILICLVLSVSSVDPAPVRAVDYFWNNSSGGAYDEPSNWTPFSPPATQGPGGVNDTVNFDLGVAVANRYVVTDAGRENSQLVVHNDSVELTVFVNQQYSSAGGVNPSLVVGAASGDEANLVLSAGGASVLETDVTRIANAAGSEGHVGVKGLQWNGGNLRVGYAGVGALAIEQDAIVTSTNASIAHITGSEGQVWIDGSWEISGALVVGRQGEAGVDTHFGSVVSSNSAVIGDLPAGVGHVTMSGAWSDASSLIVGDSGNGTLVISASGVVNTADVFVGRQPGSTGMLTSGGELRIGGRLSVGGDADAATSGGDGAVEITGGSSTVAEDITLFPNGRLTIAGGSLDAPIITVQPGGVFTCPEGELLVETFNGNLSNSGARLAARDGSNSMLVSGEYAQGPDGVLSIEIAGDAASGQFDKLTVGNTAFPGGELRVELAATFQPLANQVYSIVDALNFGAGSFDNVANGERLFINRSRGSFLVNYGAGSPFDPSQVVLSDFRAPLDADFDNDGGVDVDDLAQWQGDFGVNGLSDADGDGDSDGADFLAWQQQAGSPPALVAAAAVPEPGMAAMILPVVAALVGYSSGRASLARRG